MVVLFGSVHAASVTLGTMILNSLPVVVDLIIRYRRRMLAGLRPVETAGDVPPATACCHDGVLDG